MYLAPRLQSLMVERSWWQELEAAGYPVLTVRKRRKTSAGTQPLSPFLFSLKPQLTD